MAADVQRRTVPLRLSKGQAQLGPIGALAGLDTSWLVAPISSPNPDQHSFGFTVIERTLDTMTSCSTRVARHEPALVSFATILLRRYTVVLVQSFLRALPAIHSVVCTPYFISQGRFAHRVRDPAVVTRFPAGSPAATLAQ